MTKPAPYPGGGAQNPVLPPKTPSVVGPDASIPFAYGGGAGSSSVIPLLIGGRTVRMIIPPGGFAGFAQQTPATQALFQRAGRVGGQRSAAKRRKRKKTAAKKTTRRKTRGKKRARLVKGSAAAKRYMASIRRKRKR
jgi:hypothetical protein